MAADSCKRDSRGAGAEVILDDFFAGAPPVFLGILKWAGIPVITTR